MGVNVGFWNECRNIVKTRLLTIQHSWINLMLRIFLRVLEMHQMGCNEETYN